jgi:tripartite-type tricarboxylate transporter receptor subunit TctC
MRLLAELAEPALGQKVVVVNKPGGAGTVGVAAVTSAKPDGYVLGAVYNAPLTMLPHLQSVPYTSEDYIPVSLSNSAPLVFCGKKDFPANNGKEFIDYLKANPSKVTYGGDGVGGTVHLAAERIFTPLGVKARLVPFQSAGETLKNFLGEHIDIYGGSFPPILPYLKEGSMKCLLLTSAERHFLVPEVMATKDLGLRDINTLVWAGVIAPKGTPPDRIAFLEKAFATAARSQTYKERMAQLGTKADGSTAAEFKKLIDDESAGMKAIIQQLGLKKN